jgi:hypothetical protein
MTAFDFSNMKSTMFNYSYWEKIDQKWQYCLKQFREEGKMENPPEMRCGKCGKMKPISAFNLSKYLVPHKQCKECEAALVSRKVAKKQTEDAWKICPHCGKRKPVGEFYEDPTTTDGYQTYCKDCVREKRSTDPTVTTKDDFTFYDFSGKNSVRNRRIEEGQAAINYKKAQSTLSFGIAESTHIIRCKTLRMRVRVDNITGAMHLVFNKDQGAAVTVKNNKNVSLINQQLADFLMERLQIEKTPGRYFISIGKNIAHSDEFVTFCVNRINP